MVEGGVGRERDHIAASERQPQTAGIGRDLGGLHGQELHRPATPLLGPPVQEHRKVERRRDRH